MAIVNTSGTLTNATNSTAAMISLSGQAEFIYLSAYARANIWFSQGTGTTGTGTGIGFAIATGDTYIFQFRPGEAKYMWQCGTGAEPYYVTEVI